MDNIDLQERGYGLILTTVSSQEEAEHIAQALLNENLAACISSFPVQSLYRWQGKVQKDGEWQLVIKTKLSLQKAIEQRFETLHPYELPEFLVLPIQGGSEMYLSWMGSQVKDPEEC